MNVRGLSCSRSCRSAWQTCLLGAASAAGAQPRPRRLDVYVPSLSKAVHCLSDQ